MLRIVLTACALTLFAAPALAGAEGLIRVVDGDTLQVGAVKVRLHGIDAPETDQICRTEHGLSWTCGAWVKEVVSARYDGKRAVCDALGTDRYGRMIATCTVDGEDIGARFVEQGLAFAYRRYSTRYVAHESAAKRRDAGLWAMQVQSPAQFRRVQAERKTLSASNREPACRIKGNISLRGGKIYHLPGQKILRRDPHLAATGRALVLLRRRGAARGLAQIQGLSAHRYAGMTPRKICPR